MRGRLGRWHRRPLLLSAGGHVLGTMDDFLKMLLAFAGVYALIRSDGAAALRGAFHCVSYYFPRIARSGGQGGGHER